MRYFFIIYAIIALLVVGIFGFRGQHSSKPPIRIFPDMDEQDKLRAQKPEPFFADGHGGGVPGPDTPPRGFYKESVPLIGGGPGGGVTTRRASASPAASRNTNSAARPAITTPARWMTTTAAACRPNWNS